VGSNLPEKKTFTITRWQGGYCDGVDSFEIEDNELASCKNLDVDLRGIVKVRKSQEIYTDMVNSDADGKKRFKNLHRFCNRANNKHTFGFNEDGYLVCDSNDGIFSLVAGDGTDYFATSKTFASFAQFRDTLFISTGACPVMVYNEVATPKLQQINIPTQQPGELLDASVVDSATGILEEGGYYYAATFDIYVGDEFVGETAPLTTGMGIIQCYGNAHPDLDLNSIELKKSNTGNSYVFPDGAKYINIYRTLKEDVIEYPFTGNNGRVVYNDAYAGFYYLKSILVSDYSDAAVGDVIYEDNGNINPDTSYPINYYIFGDPPRARFLCYHKNRMWYAWASVMDEESESYVSFPSRLYFSEHLAPGQILNSSWVDISPANDDEITGMMSWNNRVLIVFKNNSTWILTGADDEIAPGVPDIRIEMLDGSIGCVAPNSIAMVEGAVVWLSNRGPYYYDGSYPKPLKVDQIREAIKRIPPTQVYGSCGVFHTRDRAYLLSTCDSALSEDPAINNTVWKYLLDTQCWSRHVKTHCGVGAWVEIKKGDESPYLLAACDALDDRMDEVGSVMAYDYREGVDMVWDPATSLVTSEYIPWEMQTKFFDLGRPDYLKQVDSVDVQHKSTTPFNVDMVLDASTDTRTESPSETVTIGPSAGANDLVWGVGEWNVKYWNPPKQVTGLVKSKKARTCKRVSFVLSGWCSGVRTQIQRLSVHFTPKEKVD